MTEKSKKIEFYSRLLKWFSLSGMVLLPLFLLFYWFLDGLWIIFATPGAEALFQLSHISLAPLSRSIRIYGFLIDLIPNSFYFFILFNLKKLFSIYEQNEFFTKASIKHLRYIAFALLISQIFHPLYVFLNGYILTLAQLSTSIPLYNLIEVKNLFLGLIFLLVSKLMEVGNQLEEENKGTI